MNKLTYYNNIQYRNQSNNQNQKNTNNKQNINQNNQNNQNTDQNNDAEQEAINEIIDVLDFSILASFIDNGICTLLTRVSVYYPTIYLEKFQDLVVAFYNIVARLSVVTTSENLPGIYKYISHKLAVQLKRLICILDRICPAPPCRANCLQIRELKCNLEALIRFLEKIYHDKSIVKHKSHFVHGAIELLKVTINDFDHCICK